jgi:hypothetical protein
MEAIEEFWECLIENLSNDPNQDQQSINLDEPLLKLQIIDPSLSFVIKPQIINMRDYEFGNPLWEKYLEKMNVMRYCLEITASGDSNKFPLIEQIVSAGDAYQLPEDWTVTKFCSSIPSVIQNALIPNKPGSLISLATIKFILQKRDDDDYHLALFMDTEFVSSIKDQEEIDQFRNGVLIFLESVIGEYYTATAFKAITILPETEITKFIQVYNTVEPRNGVYLLHELSKFNENNNCRLCAISEINTSLKDHGKLLEYPYITGFHCDACFTLLKNFRPMYIKLRKA